MNKQLNERNKYIMKLEVGMYVRTEWDCICKLININDYREPNMKYGVEANYLKDIAFIGKNEIKDASFNIIDLIEVGDYVNGSEICKISWDSLGLILETTDYFKIRETDIKTVLTKQQFESMSYRIGE